MLSCRRRASAEEVEESKGDFDSARRTFLPTLTTPGVVVSPSLETMARMSERELAAVECFTLAHPDCGAVEWHGHTDVRGLRRLGCLHVQS